MENNESAGIVGRGTDLREQFQVSGSTTEGTASNNATNGTEVVARTGNTNGDTETTNQGKIQEVSAQVSPNEEALEGYVSLSLAKDLAAYNAITIKRLYPKAWDKFLSYCKSLAGEIETMDEETAMGLLLAAPRTVLPGFFDQRGVYVNTEYGSDSKWAFNIKTKDIEHSHPFQYVVRVRAEVAAFLKAFEILEQNS